MASTGGNDNVTNKQLYDELTGLRADLAESLAAKADVAVTNDHENRLRSLERFRYAFPSIALIGLATALALAVFNLLHPLGP